MNLEFHFDIVCPYAYLASTQVENLSRRHGLAITWKPILLGGLYNSLQAPQHPATTWPVAKAEHNARDLLRQAELLGVPLSFPEGHPRRSVEAMRLLVLAEDRDRKPLAQRLYAAYWVEGRDISDRGVLAGIGAEFGLVIEGIDTPPIKEELRQRTAEALERGHFGVPTLQWGDRFWWGVDRLPLLESALGSKPDSLVPSASPGGHLRFFHDFSSPFSYLASTQVERIAKHHGAELEWTPILLGALFREIGTPDVPLFAMNASKQAWMGQDMQAWAQWWGVPLQFPSHFPLRTVTALRLSLLEPGVTPAIYAAAWAEDRDISQAQVLAEILEDEGLDAPALLEQTSDPAIKAQLRTNTERAAESGVCGVPTFVVNDTLLFWGQDRLAMVERALDGWIPEVDTQRGPIRN